MCFVLVTKGPAEGSTAGTNVGPVSNAQPFESQPVAAGPAKVGANSPRLDELTTAFVTPCAAGAAALPLEISKRPPLTRMKNVISENQIDLLLCTLLNMAPPVWVRASGVWTS